MPKGLYGKYIVQKADGSPTDPGAEYFVLRLDTDRIARAAARFYAVQIRHENPTLAQDLQRQCNEIEAGGGLVTSLLDYL